MKGESVIFEFFRLLGECEVEFRRTRDVGRGKGRVEVLGRQVGGKIIIDIKKHTSADELIDTFIHEFLHWFGIMDDSQVVRYTRRLMRHRVIKFFFAYLILCLLFDEKRKGRVRIEYVRGS